MNVQETKPEDDYYKQFLAAFQNPEISNLPSYAPLAMNEDGSYSIRLSNGVIKTLAEIPSNTEIYEIINQERKNEKSALLRKSLAERIGIAIDRFNVAFSQVFIELDNLLNNSNTMNNLDELIKMVTY